MDIVMRKIVLLSVALGLGALAACQESPREEQAENIEANADNAAEGFEAFDELGHDAEDPPTVPPRHLQLAGTLSHFLTYIPK